MNGKLLNGSICLTEIVERAKKGHSAFTKAENGKIYFNVSMWFNEDEPDKYGNHMSVLLNSKKESREVEGKVYIGNAKLSDKFGSAPVTKQDIKSMSDLLDDAPF